MSKGYAKGDEIILEGETWHVVDVFHRSVDARRHAHEAPGRTWRRSGRQYLVLRPVPPDYTARNPFTGDPDPDQEPT